MTINAELKELFSTLTDIQFRATIEPDWISSRLIEMEGIAYNQRFESLIGDKADQFQNEVVQKFHAREHCHILTTGITKETAIELSRPCLEGLKQAGIAAIDAIFPETM